MEQIKFEHRYRCELETRLQQALALLQMDRSQFSAVAVYFSRALWRLGRWHPTQLSPFLRRIDKKNKVTVWIRLDPFVHLALKKMAAALNVSMAEMLRWGIDLLATRVLKDGPGIVDEVLSPEPRPALRIMGINVLDHIDHVHYAVGGKLDFALREIRDIGKERDGPGERYDLLMSCHI